jgi:hypothetical protein
VHLVGPKDSGSQNFTFLALKGKAAGVAKILYTTATVRDRRIFFALIKLFIHKKYKKNLMR